MAKWHPEAALQDVESDRVEGNSAAYNELLSKCPVAHVDVDENSDGYWGVFAYDELMKAATDVKTFSNVTPLEGPRILPLQSDPPEHTAYRRLLNRFFSDDEVAKVEAEVRPFAAEMIDGMVARGTTDFAEEFAYPFPTRVLCKLFRLPDEDWPIHHEFVMELERRTGHGLSEPTESLEAPLQQIMPYLHKMVSARRSSLGDDVVSGIITGEIQGQPLDDNAVIYMIITLMMAGHITTTSGIGNLVLRLARDTEIQSFLRANPDRIPDAVEESLRIDTPQQAMPRKCMEDTEIGGQEVKAGEYMLLNFGSANVDPKHWPAPENFDIDRSDKRHLGFGRGVHKCLGASLARMEMRVVIEELLARTESFELSGDVRRRAWPRMSVESMPLSTVPRAAGEHADPVPEAERQ